MAFEWEQQEELRQQATEEVIRDFVKFARVTGVQITVKAGFEGPNYIQRRP